MYIYFLLVNYILFRPYPYYGIPDHGQSSMELTAVLKDWAQYIVEGLGLVVKLWTADPGIASSISRSTN